MSAFVRGVQRLTRWFAVASAAMTLIVMTLTCADVFSRILTGGSVPGLLELGEVALVVLVYAGIAQAQQANVHVAVDVLTARLPVAVARTLIIIGLSFAALVVAWAVYATGVLAIDSVERQESRFGITAVPIWPARLLIPLGLLLLLAEIGIDIADVAAGRDSRDEPVTPAVGADRSKDAAEGRTPA